MSDQMSIRRGGTAGPYPLEQGVTRALLILTVLCGAAQADSYEDLGNCKEEAFTATSVKPIRTVVISRDDKHRITRRVITSGVDVTTETREYDAQGRLATIKVGDVTISHDYDGKTGKLVRATEVSKGGTRTWTRAYDELGRLARESAREGVKTVIDKRYTYDDKNRIDEISMDGGATTEKHKYDDKSRMVRNDVVISHKPYQFTYAYDAKDRRIEQTQDKNKIVYSYDCR